MTVALQLSDAEQRVMEQVCRGLSYRQIGIRLGRSTSTVATQGQSAFLKLGATSREEAIEAFNAPERPRCALDEIAEQAAAAAAYLSPTEANLRGAVTRYRTRPCSGTAKLIAAAALALAADLANVERQVAA